MATAPTSRRLNLTRDQLATFLTDQQQIRQFELLFSTVDQIQVIVGTDFEYQADNAAATANEALAQIAALAATLELQTRPELGTLSPQNADRVFIKGGTINNTAIGETTPAAGTFTTLTATGQTSLGGVAGNESLRVLVPATAGGAYETVQSGSNFVEHSFAGTQTNISHRTITRGIGSIFFSTNNSATNLQFQIAHTASAVNYVQVTGAATGGAPTIRAQGSDANIPMLLQTKGVGVFRFRNGSNQTAFTGFAPNGAANFIGIQSVVSGSAPILGSEGSDTNIDLALTPKGTGNVRFGTYTANMALVVQGYIEIKDSGGTVRKLAVIA